MDSETNSTYNDDDVYGKMKAIKVLMSFNNWLAVLYNHHVMTNISQSKAHHSFFESTQPGVR